MDAEKAGLKLGAVEKPRKNGDEKRLPTDDAVPEEYDADIFLSVLHPLMHSV